MSSPVAGSLKRDLLFALLGAILLNAFMALTFLDKIKVPEAIEGAFLALCLPTLLVVGHLTVSNLVVLIALAAAINVVLHGRDPLHTLPDLPLGVGGAPFPHVRQPLKMDKPIR